MSDANTWRLAVEHISRYHYEASIQGSVMSLRLYPRKDQGQRVLSFGLEIEPETVPIEFQDSYGNTCHMISIHKQISESILIKSKMEVAAARAPDLTDDVDLNLLGNSCGYCKSCALLGLSEPQSIYAQLSGT